MRRWFSCALAQVFYAACQGLLYVLCYRLEQLMAGFTAHKVSAGPAETENGGSARVICQLFADVMPKLLHHRCAHLPSLDISLVHVPAHRGAVCLNLCTLSSVLVPAAGQETDCITVCCAVAFALYTHAEAQARGAGT